MRNHKQYELPQIGAKYRALTVSDELNGGNDFVTPHVLPKHHRDFAYVHALFQSKGVDSVTLNVVCPDCKEKIIFNLQRNQLMIDEMEDKLYGKEIKIKMNAPMGDEELIDLIDYVVIDDDQLFWKDCKDSEKEAVLESIDFDVFKSISAALEQPAVVANIPVVCSCGYERVVSLRGLQAFLEVLE